MWVNSKPMMVMKRSPQGSPARQPCAGSAWGCHLSPQGVSADAVTSLWCPDEGQDPRVPAVPGAEEEGAERSSDLVEVTGQVSGLEGSRNVWIH